MKLPEDIKENIRVLSEKVSKEPKELLVELKGILENNDKVASMECSDEHKLRFSYMILYRKYSSMAGTLNVYFMPLTTPQARGIKIKGENTYVASVQGLIQLKEDGKDSVQTENEWIYSAGTFWKDAAKQSESLKPKHVYSAKIKVTDQDWGKTISADETTFEEVKDIEKPNIKKFFKDKIYSEDKVIACSDIDINEKENDVDIRIIKGTIVEATIGERDDKSTYGMYSVMDNSIAGSTTTVFLHPDDVIWEQGSVCWFVGTIRKDKNGIHRWDNHCIIPTDMVIPRTYISTSGNKKEEVELDLSDDDLSDDSSDESDSSLDDVTF